MEFTQSMLDKMLAKTQKSLAERPKGGGNYPKQLKRDTIPICINESDPGAILRVVYPDYLKAIGFPPWVESRACTVEYSPRQFATFHSPGYWGRPDLEVIGPFVDELLTSSDKGEVDFGRRLAYRPVFYLPVVDMKNVGEGVQFLSCSAALFEAFFAYLGDQNFNNERSGYLWDPTRGANFIVQRFGKGLDTKWKAKLERGSSTLPNADEIQSHLNAVNIFDLITLDPPETFTTAMKTHEYEFKDAMKAARDFMDGLNPPPLPKLLPSGQLWVPDALLEAWELSYQNPDPPGGVSPAPPPEPTKPEPPKPTPAAEPARRGSRKPAEPAKPAGPSPDNPEGYVGLTIKFPGEGGKSEIGEVLRVLPSTDENMNGALVLEVETGDGGPPWEVAPGKVLEIVDAPKAKAPESAATRRTASAPEPAPATSPAAGRNAQDIVNDVLGQLRKKK